MALTSLSVVSDRVNHNDSCSLIDPMARRQCMYNKIEDRSWLSSIVMHFGMCRCCTWFRWSYRQCKCRSFLFFLMVETMKFPLLFQDGGCTNPGDVAKAFGAGTFV